MSRQKALTPGSQARIFRDGNVLVSAMPVPQSGAMTVRSLDPGKYEARDELGGLMRFTVDAKSEVTTIWEPRSGRGEVVGAAEPGASSVVTLDEPRDTRPWHPLNTPAARNVGGVGVGEPERSDAPEHFPPIPERESPKVKEFRSDDVRVEGAPGSALVEMVEDEDSEEFVDLRAQSVDEIDEGAGEVREEFPDRDAVTIAEYAREREATQDESHVRQAEGEVLEVEGNPVVPDDVASTPEEAQEKAEES